MISCMRRILCLYGKFQKPNLQFSKQKQAEEFHKAALATRIIKLIKDPYTWANKQIESVQTLTGHFTQQTTPIMYRDFTSTQNIQNQDLFSSNKNSLDLCQQHSQIVDEKKNRISKKAQKISIKESQKALEQRKQYLKRMPLKTKVMKQIQDYMKPEIPLDQEDIKAGKYPQETAKRYLMSYFMEGVWIHNIYCSQERFKNFTISSLFLRQIKKRNQVYDQSFLGEYNDQQVYKKLTFFPSHLTTTQTFKSFDFSQKGILLTGHFGIGKTYSFILYRVLSEMIFRYKHKYCRNLNFNQLPAEIDFTIYKMVYWSILFTQKKDYYSILQQVILNQCYQLKYYQPKQIGQKKYQFKLFKENSKVWQIVSSIFHSLGIKTILTFDQINVIARAYRNYRNYIKAQKRQNMKKQYLDLVREIDQGKKEKKEKDQYQAKIQQGLQNQFGDRQNIFKEYNQAKKIRRVINYFISEFEKMMYLSSQTIQRHLLTDLNLTGQDSHTPISIKKLKFLEEIQKPQTRVDTAEFFVSFLSQHINLLMCQNQNDNKKYPDLSMPSEQQFDKIRKQFTQLLQKNELIISPFAISRKFDKNSNPDKDSEFLKIVEDIIMLKSKKYLKNNLKILIDILNNFEKQVIFNQFKKFLNKKCGNQVLRDKKVLLSRLLLQVKRRKQDKNQGIQVSNSFKIKTADLFVNVNSQQIDEDFSIHLDRNLFSYDRSQGFSCKLHQNVIIQVLGRQQKQLYEALLQSEEKLVKLLNGSSTGNIIQSLIKNFLTLKGTTLTSQLNFDNTENEKGMKFQMNKINENLYFDTIPQINWKSHENFSFLAGFKQQFENIKEGDYLFIPRKKTNIQKVSETSKLIDFIIVTKNQKKIQIYAFDPTVIQNEYNSKIKRFLMEFANFKDRQTVQIMLSNKKKYQVTLKYFVVCPENLTSKNDEQRWQYIVDESANLIQENILKIQQKKKKKQYDQSKDIKEKGVNLQIRKLNQVQKLSKIVQNRNNLITRLKKNKDFLNEIVVEKKNPYAFTVIKKDSIENKKLLLKEIGVLSFSKISLTNALPQNQVYVRIFEKLKKDYKK